MKLNIQKIRTALVLSIWEYDVQTYDGFDQLEVDKFVNNMTERNITIPTADVEYWVDYHEESIFDSFNPEGSIDINTHAAIIIANDLGKSLSENSHPVNYKILTPCKSHA